MATRSPSKTSPLRPYVEQFQSLRWGEAKAARITEPAVLIHGGLGDQLARRVQIVKALQRIGKAIQPLLKSDKAAAQLAVAAVGHLEDEPIFNAGFGARLQQDGVPRLSSSVMDGARRRFSSVSNVLSQRHPSLIALSLQEKRDRNLCSHEASLYAYSQGFTPEHVETLDRVLEYRRKLEGQTGTVGAVVLDRNMQTAACTSTGGRGFEVPGRISDSCTSAGNFASGFAAVSCTGVGEEIVEAALASSIVTRVEDGFDLSEAVTRSFRAHQSKTFGVISLDQFGNACVYATKGALSFALITRDQVSVGLLPQDWARICRKSR